MKYKAAIDVMPQKEILDPQGKAVLMGLKNLGISQAGAVRIGKHITLEVDAESEEQARQLVDKACQKLLANLIMEEYTFTVQPA